MIAAQQTRHEDMQSKRRMDGPRQPTTRMVGEGDDDEEDRRAKAADDKDGQGGRL